MKIYKIISLLFIVLLFGFRQNETKRAISEWPNVTISQEEIKLYDDIMKYRKSKKLPSIPLSKSLTHVAQTHCKDLVINRPDLKKECNTHSWSDKGTWSSCCYTRDHKQAECMWNKPKELTTYENTGYEIAVGSSDPAFDNFQMTAEYALSAWKKSVHHNNVIINRDLWEKAEWKAIGVGMYKGFACVWFGKYTDAEGEPLKE